MKAIFCIPTTALLATVTGGRTAPSLTLPPSLRQGLAAAYRRLAELIEEPEPRVAEKRRMTVSVPGGRREMDMPRLLRSALALNDRQIAAMADITTSLEATMG